MNEVQKSLIEKIEGKYPYFHDSGQLIINADCLVIMELLEDKSVDLVLTDPPYGIGEDERKADKSGRTEFKTKNRWDDKIPKKEIFDCFISKSNNQIIWGGNYFIEYLKNTRCFLIWDKIQSFTGADSELAWTSFEKSAKTYRMSRIEFHGKEIKDHPTQKPLRLIEWCVNGYSEERDLILDCFSGSGTTAIASYKTKRNSICIELDEEYYKKSCDRLKQECDQLQMF